MATFRAEAVVAELGLQRRDFVGGDDRSDIAVGTHERPITRRQGIGVTEMIVPAYQVAARPEATASRS